MPNLPISGLNASAANLASTDLLPVVQTSGVGPVKMTGLQLAGGLLGSTVLNGSTLTGASAAPVLNMSQTWNNGTTTFTGLKFNATDTASASGSLLLDIGTGGGSYASAFKVRKDGYVITAGAGIQVGTSFTVQYTSDQATVASAISIGWGSTDATSAQDLILRRAAAATLQLGAADAAGSAISISSVASNQLTLASNHGLSNGAAVIITGSAAPTGTSLNTLYYARSISATVLELYDTYQNAITTSGTTGRVSVSSAGTSASVNRATPFQTFQPQSFTGTDIPGQPFIINGSKGTGTGAGGSIIFQVAPAGTTGTAQNALQTVLQITGAGGITGQDGVTANTLALRNGANAQIFRVYSTTASSGSYGIISAGVQPNGTTAQADTLYIGSAGAGTAMTKLALVVNGTTSLTLLSNRATFVSDIYVTSGNVVIGRSATAYSIIASTASNRLELYNSNATDAPLVTFGGTASSFPALKRSSASLQVRLADDSGYTTIDALLRSQGTAPATAASTGTAGDIRYDSGYIYVCTATDTWKRVAIATW